MNADDMKMRTKEFALRSIRLCGALKGSMPGDVIGRQLLRSATSVAANYRAACRARSKAEFVAKLGIVEEEADESQFWLELISESGLLPESKTRALHVEAGEITAIVVASVRTARGANPQSAIRNPHSP